jgi:hypothetical protein
MTTEKAVGLRTVECGGCGRIVNIAPAVISQNKEIANAGHANIERGLIQCACGRQL